MRKIGYFLWTILLILLATNSSIGQKDYFQQDVKYYISAELDSSLRILRGAERISYKNNSPDALTEIYMHLWTNAFSSNKTPFADNMLKLDKTEFYFANEDERGGYDSLSFEVREKSVEWEYLEGQPDIVKIKLASPLAPGGTTYINIKFKSRIPKLFSRTGYDNGDLHMTYWYPKVAVYDHEGWHPISYYAQGELYSDFAEYSIELNVPADLKLFSTGKVSDLREGSNGINKYEIKAKNVVDFAWFAIPNRRVQEKEFIINDRTINLNVVGPKEADVLWLDAMNYLTESVKYYSEWIGDYPYDQLTLIQDKNHSGMEYPQIITASHKGTAHSLDYIINHEVGHQWFFGVLGFNEREHAWMDEGLTTYGEHRYTRNKYGMDAYTKMVPSFMRGSVPVLQSGVEGQIKRRFDQPISTKVEETSVLNYLLNNYERTAIAFRYLESYLTTAVFDNALRSFYDTWKFKHPYPKDMQASFEESTGKDLDWFFKGVISSKQDYDYELVSIKKVGSEYLVKIKNNSDINAPLEINGLTDDEIVYSKWIEGDQELEVKIPDEGFGKIVIDAKRISPDAFRTNNYTKTKGLFRRESRFRINPFLKLDEDDRTNIITNLYGGYNTSDGSYLGFSMFNSLWPQKDLKRAFAFGYAFGSKEIVGMGKLSFDQHLESDRFKKIEYKLGVKSFHFENNTFLDYRRRYFKLDPSLTLHFRPKATSKSYSKLIARSMQIWNQVPTFSPEGFEGLEYQNSLINELRFEHYNFSTLSPFTFKVAMEQQSYDVAILNQNKRYIKVWAEYDAQFKVRKNYQMGVRFFAGGFLTNSERESSSYNNGFTRGSFALSHEGYDDYKYDGHYVNRNNQNVNSLYNQIGLIDGGFKTALGSQYNRIDHSNDLMFALNLTSDFPVPLPKFLPLKLFSDFGYFTNVSIGSEGLEGNFLYSAGPYLDFGLIQVYLPILNSESIDNVIGNNDQSLWSKISFRMDLHKNDPWQIVDDFNF